ncbi:MAG: thiamine pyrophosphate-binding protein [Rhodospirillales bacterium]|nr:thiamine pyrophosphate-binding protein [Rhodospirillales bacterium]
MMKRDEALKILAGHITNDTIVVAAYTSAFEWIAIRPSPLNFIFTGAMGLASSHALGLAVGRPDRRVIVLDGDGSLLMNLGSLVTIAQVAPPNLIHFVCENGTYEANGGHPIPGSGKVDFAGFAKSAGYADAREFSQISDFDAGIGALLQAEGPVFATLKVEPGAPPEMDYAMMHGAEIRRDFKAALDEI